jgi:hypothetical protein
MYSITETNDYMGLAEMFFRNGLEISPVILGTVYLFLDLNGRSVICSFHG